jgi:hypothetical protein
MGEVWFIIENTATIRDFREGSRNRMPAPSEFSTSIPRFQGGQSVQHAVIDVVEGPGAEDGQHQRLT